MRIFLTVCAAAATIALGAIVPASPAAVGDILRTYPAVGSGATYWASVAYCIKDGLLYESFRKSNGESHFFKRDPLTGDYLGQVDVPYGKIACITYDSKRDSFWVTDPWSPDHSYTSVYDVLQVPYTGGEYTFAFAQPHWYGDCGVWYEASEDKLWICDNNSPYIGRFNPDNGGMELRLYVPQFSRLVGVCRVGDRFWVSQLGGEEKPPDRPSGREALPGVPLAAQWGVIHEANLDGTATGVNFTLPNDRVAAGLTFDGRYLWTRGINWSDPDYLYQIDIGYGSGPTPPPAPTPPPSADILDYNGDGASDIGIWRPSNGLWSIKNITRVYLGASNDRPAPLDYDGDGVTEIAVFDAAQGLWASSEGARMYLGTAGDWAAPGDYNGDGTEEPAIFRPSNGLWYVNGVTRFTFGGAGDIPLYADFDLDGTTDAGIFRPSNGLWALRGGGRVYYGTAGDYPVPGNYRGGDSQQTAVFRPSAAAWGIRNMTTFVFGTGSYYPQPGDWNGDGLTEPCGFWNAAGGSWAIRGIGNTIFGAAGDVPVSARIFGPIPVD